MPGKEKRPPISIEELGHKKQAEREEAVRGSLSYVGGQKPLKEVKEEERVLPVKGIRGVLKRGFGSNSVKLLLPILASVLLAAIMLYQFAPSKALVNRDIGSVRDAVSTVSTQLNYESSRIDNIVGKLGTYASTGELATLKEELTELSSLKASLGVLETELIQLDKRLKDLEERQALEE